ncbi:LysR family transcriptional regulator [Corynebacterium sp.]|uniref:LysR family transcriptional regulator n=1 Tax=Corynebacterium sp. TaxID=1720 RepID=UPI003F94E3F0
MTDLTLDQLSTVVSVAEQHGFTAAADTLNVSQSALSRTVAQVEKAAGLRFFERTTRSFTVTDPGRAFVRMAKTILEVHRREINNFTSYIDGPYGTLRLATLPSLAATFLPTFINRFHSSFPNVSVDVHDLMAATVIEQCRAGLVDVAITAEDAELFATLPDHFRFSPMSEEEFACILPVNHPLAAKETLNWEDLAGLPFVSFTEASSVRRITDRELASRGVVPAETVSAGTISAVTGLCAANLGVSAVPGFVIPMTRVPGVVIRALHNSPEDPTHAVRRRIGILVDEHRPLTPAASGFLTLLSELSADDVVLPDFTTWTGLEW